MSDPTASVHDTQSVSASCARTGSIATISPTLAPPYGNSDPLAGKKYGTNRLSKDKRVGLLGGSFGRPNDGEWTSALPPNLRWMVMPVKDTVYFIVNQKSCPQFTR